MPSLRYPSASLPITSISQREASMHTSDDLQPKFHTWMPDCGGQGGLTTGSYGTVTIRETVLGRVPLLEHGTDKQTPQLHPPSHSEEENGWLVQGLCSEMPALVWHTSKDSQSCSQGTEAGGHSFYAPFCLIPAH